MARASGDDYYAILGIDQHADDEEIRRAWRTLALEWHPDRAGAGATAMFQKISIAYAVLSDPMARSAFDRRRGTPPRPPRSSSTETPADAPIGRRAPGVLLTRISGPLNILLARGVAKQIADDLIEIFLDREESTEGGMVTISMYVPIRCDACASAPDPACARCGGQRVIDELFSAWLAVRPGVADGTMLKPSANLPGMLHPVAFRVRLPAAG